ncbi:MAG: hypothetical protein LBQ55_04820 [Treponema sp.]|jgi:hypothetical protein|nr:hypothetical protein [Treponema sp.]
MKKRALCSLLLTLAAVPFLPGEEEDPFPFPLAAVIKAFAGDAVYWRPDWPPELPPDAFSLPAGTEGLRSVTLSAAGDPAETALRVLWDGDGGLAEIPYFWRGAFYRAGARTGPLGELRGLVLSGPPAADGAPGLSLELELSEDFDAPHRVVAGDRVFWVLMTVDEVSASETWYDGEGNFAGFVKTLFAGNFGPVVSLDIRGRWAESYDYYSVWAGGISRVESPGGVYTAVYGERGPLYRGYAPAAPDKGVAAGPADEGAAADLDDADEESVAAGPADEGAAAPDEESAAETVIPDESVEETAAAPFPPETGFQWDERGFLVRVTGTSGEDTVEYRYEYETDDRGNWTVRREIEMVRRAGLLVPVFRQELRRGIEYAEE